MSIFSENVFMIGDFVQYTGRGGSKRTHSNVWEITEIVSGSVRKLDAVATVLLINGAINDSNNHEYGPGYIRKYLLKNLKHVEELGA